MRLVLLALLATTLTAGTVFSSPGSDVIAPYPKVVIYTSPSCRSCTAANDYFLKNNIPFVKKDINANERYFDEMTEKYKSMAVPVIVIGKDQKVLRGFTPDLFQKAFKDVLALNSK
jgi:glutaredoxin